MNVTNLLEIARLRSIVQRLRRERGAEATLAILRRVIETEFKEEIADGSTTHQ